MGINIRYPSFNLNFPLKKFLANNTTLIAFRYSFASIILAVPHASARERSLILKKI